MAGRRTFTKRFLFASRAIHRCRRRPDVEVLEGRALLATLTVKQSGADAGIGSNNAGDLRYCINQANADDQANTIVFDSTVFRTPQTITLSGGQLELSDTGGAQTITGPAALVTIGASEQSSVFQVGGGVTASISGLAFSDYGSGSEYSNGVVLSNSGVLGLDHCTISGSSANLNYARGVYNRGTANLSDCTITGGASQANGAGVYNSGTANLTGCTISGSSAIIARGGGVFNSRTGNLTLTDCTVSGNSAFNGGGVYNSGTANLTDCTVSGNSAPAGSGGFADLRNSGGGVYNRGTANLTDCTLSGNSATGSHGFGGGVYNYGPTGNLILTACTLSGNSAPFGGGLYNPGGDYGGTVGLTDTIIAGNANGGASNDIGGSVSGSYNLIGTGGSGGLANGVDGNIVLTSLTDLGLVPLGNNGGPTQTMALLPGSPAPRARVHRRISGVTTDQRGVPRGNVLDIGAYQATATHLVVSGFPSSTAPGVSHNFTVNAVDPFGQPALDFNSPVTFTSSDPSATLPTGKSLVAGHGTFTATLNTTGVQSITASADGLVGSQTGITVSGAPATASFLQQDTTTRGSWIGTYGAQGYDIVSGPTSLPANDTVTPSGQATYTWTTTSSDPRALQVPGSSNRVAAVWDSATSFTVDVNLGDGLTHNLELYFLDWDSKVRSEQVQISDAGTGAVLDTETISSFNNGVYLDWRVAGNLAIKITRTAGLPMPCSMVCSSIRRQHQRPRRRRRRASSSTTRRRRGTGWASTAPRATTSLAVLPACRPMTRSRPAASRLTPGPHPPPPPAPCRFPARPAGSPPSGTRRRSSPSTSTWRTARRTTWSCTSSTGTARAGASRCSSATRARARCWTPRPSRRSPMACTWTGRSRATC